LRGVFQAVEIMIEGFNFMGEQKQSQGKFEQSLLLQTANH